MIIGCFNYNCVFLSFWCVAVLQVYQRLEGWKLLLEQPKGMIGTMKCSVLYL